jgi:RNA-binding protein
MTAFRATRDTKSTKRAAKPKRRSAAPKRITKRTGDVRSKPDQGAPAAAPSGPLTGKALRYLRGLGHHLAPVVQIGKEGITDALVAATREALLAHELVKVRVGTEAPIDRRAAGEELAGRAGAALAQTLGRTLLLYKRHPRKPKIALPR